MNQQKFDLGLIDLRFASRRLFDGAATNRHARISQDSDCAQRKLGEAYGALRQRSAIPPKKPLHAHQILKTLKIAIGQLTDEGHSSYRHSVDVTAGAVLMANGSERHLRGAKITNISYTGLCLFCEQSLPMGEIVAVHFYLPSTGKPVRLAGKIILV